MITLTLLICILNIGVAVFGLCSLRRDSQLLRIQELAGRLSIRDIEKSLAHLKTGLTEVRDDLMNHQMVPTLDPAGLEDRLIFRIASLESGLQSTIDRLDAKKPQDMTDEVFFEMSKQSAEIQRIAQNAARTFLEKEFADGGRSLAVVSTKTQALLKGMLDKASEEMLSKLAVKSEPVLSDDEFIASCSKAPDFMLRKVEAAKAKVPGRTRTKKKVEKKEEFKGILTDVRRIPLKTKGVLR